MFSFLLNNNYRKPMGIILFIFGIACYIIAALTYKDMGLYSTLLLVLLGSLYTIFQPILLKRNANIMVSRNPVYNLPLHYDFDDKGVTVAQGEESTFKPWDEMWKARDFGKIAVIYIAVNNGIILPKEAIGTQYPQFKELVKKHLPSNLK